MKDFFGFRQNAKEAWLRSCLLQNESKLIRYIKNLVHDLEVSKDITQDTFMKLWQQDHEKLKGVESQWLFTTGRNRAYDFLRRKNRLTFGADELSLEVPDPAPNSEEQLVSRGQDEVLQELLKSLTPQQREILDLKFHQGLSYKEISAITGHSVNHVGVLIHNVVTRLKNKRRSL